MLKGVMNKSTAIYHYTVIFIYSLGSFKRRIELKINANSYFQYISNDLEIDQKYNTLDLRAIIFSFPHLKSDT